MKEKFLPLSKNMILAHKLADIADEISMAKFLKSSLRVTEKPDLSKVTEADYEIEQKITSLLKLYRPEDSILGEEYGESKNKSEYRWVIDPIDGTVNFMRGAPGWATLISLEHNDKPILGVVSSPASKQRWWAEKGHGAWKANSRKKEWEKNKAHKLQVSKISNLSQSWVSFQSIMQWDNAGYVAELMELSRKTWRDRAFGDSWSYMLLAEGVIDLVAEFDVKPYDLSAVVTIIEEAGGTFTDVKGHSRTDSGNAVASNSLIHKEALAIFNTEEEEHDKNCCR